jgi:hypothetical protein
MTTASTTDSLSTTLGDIHQRWIATVDRVLSAAMAPGAGFWARWSTARFLDDQLENFYRLEASLMEQLGPRLQAPEVARLRQGLGEMERSRAKVVALGRRRGTGTEVSRHAGALLALIRRWSDELEAATRHLVVADLSPACSELLRALEGAAGMES